ncbi:NAD-dependent epimerase/dehydratase family protein [Azospirillum sp. TSO22-1]|uniref:NAD-dependent epimerase/dehydratase family protein n=1 Tax=Azospirillum sp. TSO22-1 TaxID=716789 RepID=UPI000D61304A|nr:NAD-dependent epimerase/dehydratase family protein [Azospirillum sp. TSO22-1]PWC55341.1 NAD-dependent dehydratase [Azospirillum sp. TSO22-1]
MLTHSLVAPAPPARVVVLGAGGFIGRAVAERLAADGVPVLALSRTDVDLLAADAAERLAGHLRSDDSLVAVSALAPCRNSAMLADNLVMVRAMLGALTKVRVAHVVNIGSDAVFADGPVPLTEASPRAPDSLHGAMHLARELAFAAEAGAPLATLRPTLVYGARDPHNGYGPNRFRRLVHEGREIVLFGEGEERRDHVLVDDIAEIAACVLRHRSTGSLNVASGAVHSFRAVAEMVATAAGREVPIRGTPRSGPMPHNGYRPFDVSAIRAAFPDLQMTPLAEGLARVERQLRAASTAAPTEGAP